MVKMGKTGIHLHHKRKYHGFGGDARHVLNFKQFVILKEEEISPERAADEYAEYLHEFLSNEIATYYDSYEHLPFFREKYHPYYLQEEHKLAKDAFVYNRARFIANYESGKYSDLLLEISFRRLYGKAAVEGESNLADASYRYNEWAYEVPLEYPKDETHCKRLPLHSPLQSVILVDVPDKVFKYEIVNALKTRIENFMIYMAERDMVRTAFISIDEKEDLNAVAKNLNSDRLTVQEFLLRFEPCNPIQERIRIRVCPPICSHPVIIMRDAEITENLIRKLDAELGKGDSCFVDALPEDLDIKVKLDLQLTYLRMVHSYCYYGRIKGQNYIDLWDLSGPGHIRVDLTNDLYEKEDGMTSSNVTVKFASWDTPKKKSTGEGVEQKQMPWEEELICGCEVSTAQLQWLKDVESFALHILGTDLTPKYDADVSQIEEKWEQFCNLNTLVDGPERFRCRLCHKLFNDPKFVWKHLKLKHSDCHAKIAVECGLSQMKDLFFSAHMETKCNPFDYLVSVPVLQKPKSDFDGSIADFHGKSTEQPNVHKHNSDRKRRRMEYYDFDKPQVKGGQTITFADDEYSRPSVKYDDL